MATEPGPPFEALELTLVLRGSGEGAAPASSLRVLDRAELVGAGLLEFAPIVFSRGSSVLAARRPCLLDGVKDLAILLGFGPPPADLLPRGGYVCNAYELGSERVNRLVELAGSV